MKIILKIKTGNIRYGEHSHFVAEFWKLFIIIITIIK